MPNRERNVGINIRVTPEEKKKIARYAKRCRLTLSEYIRKVAVRDEPKVMIPKEIDDSFMKLRFLIDEMDRDISSETNPVVKDFWRKCHADLLRNTVDTLVLLRSYEAKPEETTDGDN